MVHRQSVYYYVALALLCITVVIVLTYFLKPRLETKLPPISNLSSDIESGKQRARESVDTSMKIIWGNHEEQQAVKKDGSLRNPFLWSGELRPREKTTGASSTAARRPDKVPELGMIVVAQDKRLAFLDQQIVFEGNQHRGFRVEKIDPKAVTLSHAYGKFHLIAPDDHYGPAKVIFGERSRP